MAAKAAKPPGALQCRRQRLQPGGQVHGRPDGGEVEPAAGADIAVADLAQMQRHPAAHRRLQVQRRQRQIAVRAARNAAAPNIAGLVSPKGKMASSPSPISFSTSPPSASTAGTMQPNTALTRSITCSGGGVAERGEAAQVREQDGGLDPLDIARADGTLEHPLAGARPT